MSNDNGPEGEADEPSSWEPVDDDGEMEERVRRLEEKEERLEQKERELNKRERELEKREQEILERREENVDTREELEQRQERIEEKEAALDDREQALEERERDLSRRADEIETKEEALSEHVGGQLNDFGSTLVDEIDQRVQKAVKQHAADDGGRLGAIGGLLLALVGLVLVIAGIGNGMVTYFVATYDGVSMTTLLAGDAANYGASAVMIFSGLAANLAAASGRT